MIDWMDIFKIAVLAFLFLIVWSVAWESFFAAKKKNRY